MAETFDDRDIDFSQYMDATESKQRVKSAAIYVQALIDRANDPHPVIRHHYMPWAKTAGILQFRPGEVTVWGGENGSGKSLITGQVALSLCAQDTRVCIASFEMKPIKTLERMGRQWTHFSLNDREIMCDPSERRALFERYDDFKHWTDGKLWLYDQQGTVNPKTVIAVIRYCARELGVTHFVVDNLIKCVRSDEDYEGQKTFVDNLTTVARDEQIHIHLVHHSRKTPDEFNPPRKMDSLGAGSIVNLVDNMLVVWRNKRKEDDRAKGKEPEEMTPDALLLCEKNRHGDWEGRISLWFHHRSTQFIGHPRDVAQALAAYPHDARHAE